jgi:hypothetical protein
MGLRGVGQVPDIHGAALWWPPHTVVHYDEAQAVTV